MTDAEIKRMIKDNEGRGKRLYLDTLGNLTGGYGHHFYEGSYLPETAAEMLFEDDFLRAKQEYRRLGLRLDPVRKAVVIDMIFNMGLAKVRKFKNMLKALEEKRYDDAGDHLLDSLYAQQTGGRAIRNAEMLREGKL